MRCLFSVVFLHMMRIMVTVCKLDSQISAPASKNSAHKLAKFLKARKVSHFFPSSWVLRWVFGGKML